MAPYSPSPSSIPPTTSLSKPIPRSAPPSRQSSNDGITQKVYKVASQDRIDEILTTGRRRSEALKAGAQLQLPRQHIMSLSPSQRASISTSEDALAPETGESSADDLTPIVRREPRRGRGGGGTMNYGSATIDEDSLRSRKSQTSIRRDSERRPIPELHEETDDEGPHDETWWQKQLAKYGSIELENKGSVARDHLALERTFLAWLRTSLAFASIGIAVTQLFRLNTSASSGSGDGSSDPYQHLRQLGKPLGATFLAISIVVLFVGFHRYFEAQHWIIRGKFPASRGSITLIALIALALMVTSLVVVLVVEPGAYEKRDVLGLVLQ